MSEPWEAVEVYPQRHWYLTRPDGAMFNFGGYETSARQAAAAINACAGITHPEALPELIKYAEMLLSRMPTQDQVESLGLDVNVAYPSRKMREAIAALRETK